MRLLVLVFVLLWSGLAAAAEARLVMAEAEGCIWCEKWNAQIGPIYPKTAEGQVAPLMMINARAEMPEGLTPKRPIVYTPTFILTVDGQEVERIEGYPGEDFFWGLLGMMLDQAGILARVPPSS
jgi:cytochrome c551/c552